MKRILSIIMAALLFSTMLTSCGTNGDTSNASADSTGSKTETSVSGGTTGGDAQVLNINVHSAQNKKFTMNRNYSSQKESISLFLVVGQSNFMVGQGYNSEMKFYKEGKFTEKPEPTVIPEKGIGYTSAYQTAITALDDSTDMFNVSNPNRQSGSRSGVTPPFAKRWHELTGTKVVFIQVAQGATCMHEWTPNYQNYTCTCPHGQQYALYNLAVSLYKESYEALSKDYNIMYTGYIWNQGENDEKYGKNQSNTIHNEEAYYQAYLDMHNGFMNQLELDFGGISVVRSAFSGGTAQNSMVLTFPRLAQYRLCNEIPKLYMLSTIGETCDVSMMNQGETIHYAQSTYNKMGKEMADNLANRLGIAKNKAKYSGVKVYAADGALLAAFDADGKLKEGSDVVSRGMASGKILIKLETLGTAYTIDTAVDGKKSDLIDKFGVLDWSKIPNVKKELKMVVTVD